MELLLRALACGSGAFVGLFSVLSVLAARRFRARPGPRRPSDIARECRLQEPLGRGRPSDIARECRLRESLGRGRLVGDWDQALPLPPVTVFKPVKGAEGELYRNLASFLEQDYPRFQVLFCLQSPDDPALAVLERLHRDFPKADVETVISKNRVGYNPKVNNLSNAYAFARHDLLLISDSDIRVPPDFLRRTVASLEDPEVGMATCFYRSAPGRGLGGRLDALSVNAQFLPQALFAAFFCGLRFAMGAAILIRRDVFEACGGFRSLSHHLADDYVLGNCVRDAGRRIEPGDVLVESAPASASLRDHFSHLVRWSRTIRVCQPLGYAGLALLHAPAWLALHMLLFGLRPWTLGAWLAVTAVRIVSIAWAHLAYLDGRLPRLLPQLLLLPLADLVQFAAWVLGLCSRTVVWRGQRYDITPGGRLIPRGPRMSAAGACA